MRLAFRLYRYNGAQDVNVDAVALLIGELHSIHEIVSVDSVKRDPKGGFFIVIHARSEDIQAIIDNLDSLGYRGGL